MATAYRTQADDLIGKLVYAAVATVQAVDAIVVAPDAANLLVQTLASDQALVAEIERDRAKRQATFDAARTIFETASTERTSQGFVAAALSQSDILAVQFRWPWPFNNWKQSQARAD